MSEAINIRKFTMIHNDMWASNLITVREKEILATLMQYCNKKGECFPSVREIANKLGCCMRKVRYVLKSLKEKCLIKIEAQHRKDKSQMSNFYTIYDFEEVWNAENIEDIPKIVEECLEKQRVEAIEKLKEETASPTHKQPIKPVSNSPNETKEKEIDINIAATAKGSNRNQSQTKTFNSCINNNTRIMRCQEDNQKKVKETYSMEFLKEYFNYDVILNDNPTGYAEIDSIFNIIYDIVNFTSGDVKIKGNYYPADVVVSKIMKLDIFDIQYVIEKYCNQCNKIHNHKAYVTSILYNAKEQHNLDISNQVKYDMAHIDWQEFHKKLKEQKEKEQSEEQVQEQLEPKEPTTTTDWDKFFEDKARRDSERAEQAEEQAKYVQREQAREQEKEDNSGISSGLYDLLQKIRGHKRE